jgi:hypothetical protein
MQFLTKKIRSDLTYAVLFGVENHGLFHWRLYSILFLSLTE